MIAGIAGRGAARNRAGRPLAADDGLEARELLAEEAAATEQAEQEQRDSEQQKQEEIEVTMTDMVDMMRKPGGGSTRSGSPAAGGGPKPKQLMPMAKEVFTTTTESEVMFLPATAEDFDESTKMGRYAREKFKQSVAASLGVPADCVMITGVREMRCACKSCVPARAFLSDGARYPLTPALASARPGAAFWTL